MRTRIQGVATIVASNLEGNISFSTTVWYILFLNTFLLRLNPVYFAHRETTEVSEDTSLVILSPQVR